MFDIGWQELFVLAVLAIIVVGPKDLPRAIRTVTRGLRKAKSMARELQSGFDDVVREAELEEIKAEANKIANYDIEDEIKGALDPSGELEDDMDMGEVERQMNDAARDFKDTTEPEPSVDTSSDEPAADEPVVDDVGQDVVDDISDEPKPIVDDVPDKPVVDDVPDAAGDTAAEPSETEKASG